MLRTPSISERTTSWFCSRSNLLTFASSQYLCVVYVSFYLKHYGVLLPNQHSRIAAMIAPSTTAAIDPLKDVPLPVNWIEDVGTV
jgi:hypothetical protein